MIGGRDLLFEVIKMHDSYEDPEDIYNETEVDNYSDDDELSAAEAAFMLGYLSS